MFVCVNVACQVGKGHVEFSTGSQQDAHEFYLHLINLIEKNHYGQEKTPVDCLQFKVEDRIECSASKKVGWFTIRTTLFSRN